VQRMLLYHRDPLFVNTFFIFFYFFFI